MEKRLGVLISGRGSNLQAIIDAIADQRLGARIAVVISNVAHAAGLDRARAAGLDARVIPSGAGTTRAAVDQRLAAVLHEHQVDLVCLAGFMRLLSPAFVDAFANRILNIHPSLLPAFPGLDATRQALEHGAKVTGATVHLVTADLDAGPIVLQAPVPILDTDTAETLAARVLEEEHRLYPRAIHLLLAGGWRIEGRRFIAPPEPVRAS